MCLIRKHPPPDQTTHEEIKEEGNGHDRRFPDDRRRVRTGAGSLTHPRHLLWKWDIHGLITPNRTIVVGRPPPTQWG